MKVTILNETTLNPISKIGEYAGICWGSDTSDLAKNYKRGLDCLKANHGRVLEYVDIEMCIEGISARLAREFYTHIGGAPTRLQESTRYVDCTDFDYTVPVSMRGENSEDLYVNTMGLIASAVERLESVGVKREDAAMLLPLGMRTKIVDKRNLRNLIEMFHQRLCVRAYWEYRDLMKLIKEELSKLSEEWRYIAEHYFVPKCEYFGWCPEVKGCKKYLTKEEQEKYIKELEEKVRELKNEQTV